MIFLLFFLAEGCFVAALLGLCGLIPSWPLLVLAFGGVASAGGWYLTFVNHLGGDYAPLRPIALASIGCGLVLGMILFGVVRLWRRSDPTKLGWF